MLAQVGTRIIGLLPRLRQGVGKAHLVRIIHLGHAHGKPAQVINVFHHRIQDGVNVGGCTRPRILGR